MKLANGFRFRPIPPAAVADTPGSRHDPAEVRLSVDNALGFHYSYLLSRATSVGSDNIFPPSIIGTKMI